MTTVAVTTTYGALADAHGAANQLTERVTAGTDAAGVQTDLRALLAALRTAETAWYGSSQTPGDTRTYALSWSTTGAGDAAAKAAALAWLSDTTKAPKYGMDYLSPSSPAAHLGPALSALFNLL